MNMTKRLKAALITLGLFLFLLAGWLKLSDSYSTDKLPDSFEVMSFLENNHFVDLPNFKLYDLKSEAVDLSELPKDKVYILNFWASWCDPCAEEFPSMVKLVKAYPKDVIILAVTNDSEKKDIEVFAKAFDLDKHPNIRIYWDKDRRLANLFKVEKLPDSFVFNRQGRLDRKVVGTRDWATPDAMSYFKTLTQ